MMLAELDGVGRSPDGGVTRFAWTRADAELREWFAARAAGVGLDVEVDGNGNLWAWAGPGLPGSAFVVGSHLDSVANGGDWDGPLGVVSALEAVARLRSEGWTPARPFAIAVFADEEGGRFGVACLGSRLLTGAIAPERALALRDDDGTTLAEAMRDAGLDPSRTGADPARVARLGGFVELHVEQGRMLLADGARGLAGAGRALGVASEIWPHGRWRLDLAGRADHAGTTALADRDDPVLAMGRAIVAVREAAEQLDVLATVGRVRVHPGAVNAIAARASLWIDARAGDPQRVRALVARIEAGAHADAVEESWTAVTRFDRELTVDAASVIGADVPVLPSGAGHDAGVLALAGVPTAMILVRNPTGVSHAPEERAEESDALEGVAALAALIRKRTA